MPLVSHLSLLRGSRKPNRDKVFKNVRVTGIRGGKRLVTHVLYIYPHTHMGNSEYRI